MLGATGYGVPMEVFDFQLAKVKKELGAKSDTDLTVEGLCDVITAYRQAFKANKGFEFPFGNAKEQLATAIKAVFESWMNPRAIEYRKINKIPETMGTAVNVQAMVFGNCGDDSGSGVLFTRDPSTGEPGMYGEFLPNAQGEDVVAGIRTPVSVHKMGDDGEYSEVWSIMHVDLIAICNKLEAMYKDMVDLEFTVQKGELFILQSRTGKRSARAAFRIAVDMVGEGVIERDTAFTRLTTDQFKAVRQPMVDPKFKQDPDVTGLPACPGVVSGRPVFSSADAVSCNEPCILVTHETNPNDLPGMVKARGVLTQTGGATSHAAVVARSLDKACVVGATDLNLGMLKGVAKIMIDGATGRVWFHEDAKDHVIDASDDPAVKTIMGWCLDKLGAVEAVVVGIPGDQEQQVFAAHWWGNEQVAEIILKDVVEHSPNATINLSATDQWADPADMALLGAFGTSGFDHALDKAMFAAMKKVPGLKTLCDKPALPADYATFKVLSV